MKTQKILITLTVAAAMAFITGCDSKKADPGTTVPAAAEKAATEVKAAAEKAVEAAPAAIDKAVTEVKAAVTPAANDTAAKVNGIIDQAKALLGQNKYTEALTSLQSLAGTALNADQEKIVAGLKEQIQKAIAAKTGANAAGAVGDLLKK